ncbi:MAG TPA: DUF72 domain-containing protein [Bacteroidia bacterium]|jgi:uncharacterized protein YecE (DUF72 family)|nr:DUF72 domain-containing protein [Bacteroidia bacterium]
MDFGKIDEKELAAVKFKLPKDPEDNIRILSKAKKASKAKIYIGCAKWGRKDWVGKIYPPKTREADFLKLYAQHFNSIELNATFYRLPAISQVEKWKETVGKSFLFCPKFSDVISHRKRLKDAGEFTTDFLKSVSSFGENLGPCFLQLPPNFTPKNFDVLKAYIESLPSDFEYFVELRHPDWFAGDVAAQTFELLEKKKIGAIITDAAGRRDCVHMHLTKPSAFIRFVGNSLHPSDYKRVDDWVNRMKLWLDGGIKSLYFFMHQHEELYSPELCAYTIRQMNKVCKLEMKVPQFVNSKGLFDEA